MEQVQRRAREMLKTSLAIAVMLFFGGSFKASTAQTGEDKGLAIAVEADARDSGFKDSSAKLVMILRSRGGDEKTRELRSQVLEQKNDGDRSLVVFESPADVKGTALLTYSHKTDDDDQWLYLPALKRVKRIGSSNKSGPFMGSEFAYEDLASQEVDKFTYKWLRDEACPGAEYSSLKCFVIEQYPIDTDSGYSREVVWIEQAEYRSVKIDYYDRKASLLKTLVFERYKQYLGRFWRAGEMLMENHQTGKSTRLLWTGYEFRVGLGENDFTPQALTRVR